MADISQQQEDAFIRVKLTGLAYQDAATALLKDHQNVLLQEAFELRSRQHDEACAAFEKAWGFDKR